MSDYIPRDNNTMDVCLMNEVLESYATKEDQLDAAYRYGQLVAKGLAAPDKEKKEIISMLLAINEPEKLERIRRFIEQL